MKYPAKSITYPLKCCVEPKTFKHIENNFEEHKIFALVDPVKFTANP